MIAQATGKKKFVVETSAIEEILRSRKEGR
jgi:hypothetical protein